MPSHRYTCGSSERSTRTKPCSYRYIRRAATDLDRLGVRKIIHIIHRPTSTNEVTSPTRNMKTSRNQFWRFGWYTRSSRPSPAAAATCATWEGVVRGGAAARCWGKGSSLTSSQNAGSSLLEIAYVQRNNAQATYPPGSATGGTNHDRSRRLPPVVVPEPGDPVRHRRHR